MRENGDNNTSVHVYACVVVVEVSLLVLKSGGFLAFSFPCFGLASALGDCRPLREGPLRDR